MEEKTFWEAFKAMFVGRVTVGPQVGAKFQATKYFSAQAQISGAVQQEYRSSGVNTSLKAEGGLSLKGGPVSIGPTGSAEAVFQKDNQLLHPPQTSFSGSLLKVDAGSESTKSGVDAGSGSTTVGSSDSKTSAIGEVSLTVELGYVGLSGGVDVDAAKEFTGMFAQGVGDMMNKITGTQKTVNEVNAKEQGKPCRRQPSSDGCE